MIAKMMTERFKLTFHHDKKELPVYVLSVARAARSYKNEGDPNGIARALLSRASGELMWAIMRPCRILRVLQTRPGPSGGGPDRISRKMGFPVQLGRPTIRSLRVMRAKIPPPRSGRIDQAMPPQACTRPSRSRLV